MFQIKLKLITTATNSFEWKWNFIVNGNNILPANNNVIVCKGEWWPVNENYFYKQKLLAANTNIIKILASIDYQREFKSIITCKIVYYKLYH